MGLWGTVGHLRYGTNLGPCWDYGSRGTTLGLWAYATAGSLWGHYGTTGGLWDDYAMLAPLRDHLCTSWYQLGTTMGPWDGGAAMGHPWGHSGTGGTMEPFVDNDRIMGVGYYGAGTMGPLWDQYGTTMGPLSDHYGTTLRPQRGHYGAIMGPL